VQDLEATEFVRWVSAAYGPHQLVAYLEAEGNAELACATESLRTLPGVVELDARFCKRIPEDVDVGPPETTNEAVAVLLITVNYAEEKERVVALQLRRLEGVRSARAMWGPADIIAVAEADDHEVLRNLICDEVKMMKGVASNTTLYCYPPRRDIGAPRTSSAGHVTQAFVSDRR